VKLELFVDQQKRMSHALQDRSAQEGLTQPVALATPDAQRIRNVDAQPAGKRKIGFVQRRHADSAMNAENGDDLLILIDLAPLT
jgi:hypothetical protein